MEVVDGGKDDRLNVQSKWSHLFVWPVISFSNECSNNIDTVAFLGSGNSLQ